MQACMRHTPRRPEGASTLALARCGCATPAHASDATPTRLSAGNARYARTSLSRKDLFLRGRQRSRPLSLLADHCNSEHQNAIDPAVSLCIESGWAYTRAGAPGAMAATALLPPEHDITVDDSSLAQQQQ
eukprot:359015-Chlamydomonas_euryale.AAC.1